MLEKELIKLEEEKEAFKWERKMFEEMQTHMRDDNKE